MLDSTAQRPAALLSAGYPAGKPATLEASRALADSGV
jgi:hypothetical protein